MSRWKWNPARALMSLPIYYRVIIANSAMALTVIFTLMAAETLLVITAVVIACGVTNALLVRAAFAAEEERKRQRQLFAWSLDRTEQERKRLASQLQDGAAQRLAALAIRSGDRAVSDEAAAVMQELCDTAQTLHPPGIQLLGLKGALAWYARSLERRFGVEVRLVVDEALEKLDQSLALGIYRILEDVLESAAHVEPGRIELYVTSSRENVHASLHVRHTLTQSEQFRLVERAAVLGGTLTVAQRDERTIVGITIPIGESSNAGYDSRLAG